MSKFGRPRPADLFWDAIDVCWGAASVFLNGKTMAAAAATARTVKIKILRIICASFGLVEVRQHSHGFDHVRNALAVFKHYCERSIENPSITVRPANR